MLVGVVRRDEGDHMQGRGAEFGQPRVRQDVVTRVWEWGTRRSDGEYSNRREVL